MCTRSSSRRRFGHCLAVVTLLATTTATIAAPQPAKPTAVTEHCATAACHGDLLGKKFMHGPAAQQKCTACHQYDEPREHRFKLASDQGKLCADCHTMKHRTVVHEPVKQGRCTGCHDPHGSDHRAILRGDPTKGLCLTCHKQDFAAKKFIHGPVNSGACILCHEPHSGWQPKLLTETPEKLCTGCHSELIPKGNQARHVHAPFKSGNCIACHDPHASDVRNQLHATAAELCNSCHKETAQVIAASHVVHGAVKDGEQCMSCHSPHFSQLPKLQKTAQPESCLSCHDKPLQTADGKTLTDFALLLKENPQQHGPIREGACTACHQPHAGEKFRLLSATYPPEFYAPFKIENYELCFKCHVPDMVLNKKGTGLTRFRDGDVNLHWLHVNRAKGRTCRACHEVHASRNPFHIRDAVPFGDRGWMLETNYKQSATGGSCSPGCHDVKAYNRGDDEGVPNVAPAPVTQKEPNGRPSGQTTLAR